jgi:uncharacterized protein (TIGR03435 family)
MLTKTTSVCNWPTLFAAISLSLLIPAAFCQTNPAPPAPAGPATKLLEFEVASVKQNKSVNGQFRMGNTPDGLRVENASLLMIIRGAYGLYNSLDDKFLGVPAWAKQEKFDIEAKVAPADTPAYQKLDPEHRQQMIQALLADRFQLKARSEIRDQPVYTLVIAKSGSKLNPSKPDEKSNLGGTIQRKNGQMVAENIEMRQLISALSRATGRTVLDKTGLTGRYDLTLTWTPDTGESPDASQGSSPSETSGASIFTTIQEQLGLKLEPTKAPVPVLVIERIERPSAN